jgi:hypothetical protein
MDWTLHARSTAAARHLLRPPLTHPLHVFNLCGQKAAACRSTCELEVNERGVELQIAVAVQVRQSFFFVSVDDRSGRSAVQWWKLEEIWLRAPTVADKQARPRPGGRFQLASRSHGGVVVVAHWHGSPAAHEKKQQKRLDSSGAQRAGSVSLSPFSRLRSASARPARPRERDDGNATNSPSESDPPHPIVPPARCSATALARSPPSFVGLRFQTSESSICRSVGSLYGARLPCSTCAR